MEKWLRDTLSKCLDCVVTDQMMTTILDIKDDFEFDNYFGNLLSEDDEQHRMFLLNCRRMLLSGKQPRNDSKGGKLRPNPSQAIVQKPSASASAASGAGAGAAKKPTKYVNLYARDGKVSGETIMLKGRRSCDCQAAQHSLVNNCLGCGRIVCLQEGSGPCLCCGEPVYTAEEEQQMAKTATSSKPGPGQPQGKTLKPKQSKSKEPSAAAVQEALAQRDRLLEYDRNSEKRTTVIDDEFDYFQENSVWLTEEEREKYERLKAEMMEMKHGSRLQRKIRVDFAGRELPEELPVSQEYEQQLLRELAAKTSSGQSAWALAPNLDIAQPPLYKPSKETAAWPKQPTHDGLERIYNRVQDKELLEMQDMRQCLSMHQPWASLLVAGIKQHEGRVWYSEHRGRLWIASTSKEPHADDIAHLEQFYRTHYNEPELELPTHYPTSSLLGCVHIDNCLPQEEYREIYPQGESDSPYVFVCSKPEQLPLLLPVQGEHKIYELPLKTHSAACKTMLRARANKA